MFASKKRLFLNPKGLDMAPDVMEQKRCLVPEHLFTSEHLGNVSQVFAVQIGIRILLKKGNID